jgi:mono/diheme cytochrome c family protein
MRKSLGIGLGLMAVVWAASARAEEPGVAHESGDSIYKSYCASCHGTSGKGDGPLADALRYRPTDLTTITLRGKTGMFPADEVHKVIDGRKTMKGHGGSDMPIWGDAFKTSRETFKAKVDALVEFLESIQVKK